MASGRQRTEISSRILFCIIDTDLIVHIHVAPLKAISPRIEVSRSRRAVNAALVSVAFDVLSLPSACNLYVLRMLASSHIAARFESLNSCCTPCRFSVMTFWKAEGSEALILITRRSVVLSDIPNLRYASVIWIRSDEFQVRGLLDLRYCLH